jgi:putative transcriptional regulator
MPVFLLNVFAKNEKTDLSQAERNELKSVLAALAGAYRRRKTTMAKKSTAGQRMIASAKQALAFANGENSACVVRIPEEINTARIRKKINMSQSEFAAYFGVSVRTVQEWEQGRVVPSGAARAFLIVIDREPDAVRRALVDFTVSGSRTPGHQPAHP